LSQLTLKRQCAVPKAGLVEGGEVATRTWEEEEGGGEHEKPGHAIMTWDFFVWLTQTATTHTVS